MLADFPVTGRVIVLERVGVDVVENFFLPFRKRFHAVYGIESQPKVQGEFLPARARRGGKEKLTADKRGSIQGYGGAVELLPGGIRAPGRGENGDARCVTFSFEPKASVTPSDLLF